MSQQQMVEEIKGWVYEAGERIKEKLQSPIIVEEKANKSDLVTNVDKETEAFFINKIRQHYPDDQILGEEGLADQVTDFGGRVWVIDPIDGTLNFVKQQDNFCTMIAVYEEGIGQLGFIYEIMRDELLWGGKGIGVFLNDQEIKDVPDMTLEKGLISVNTHMFLRNTYETQTVAMKSLGVRMIGCAGIGFKELIKGNQTAYISNLQPWDYAPAKVLIEELGLKIIALNGEPLDLRQKVPILGATPATFEEIQNRQN